MAVLLLATPVALAESLQALDPVGDERTISNLQLYDAQPQPVACHDPSIDIVAVRIERGATVRATYLYAGSVATAQLRCDEHALSATDRTWRLQLSGTLAFEATVTSTGGAPSATCVRIAHMMHGLSDCAATVTTLADGFSFELPVQGTLRYEDGWQGGYSLAGSLSTYPYAWSRVTVGVHPLQRVVFGAFDHANAPQLG